MKHLNHSIPYICKNGYELMAIFNKNKLVAYLYTDTKKIEFKKPLDSNQILSILNYCQEIN